MLELRAIAGDTQVASTRDSAVIGVEQSFGERQRITGSQAERLVHRPREGEVNEGSVRNATRDAALLAGHVRHGEVRERVVEPLLR